MKKLVSFVLALVLAASLLPVQVWGATVVDSGECGADGGNVTWVRDSDKVLTISGTEAMHNYHGNNHAPWYSNRYNIKDVQILDGVTTIGNFAFAECSNLINVTIPNSVTSIGENAFEFCSRLTNVNIPNSVTSIESEAFFCCSSLTSVSIPDSVTSIGEYAFSGCSSLTSVTIPSSVTTIKNLFQYCSSLTSVTIPNSVTSIGEYAFSGCSSLTSVNIPNSVTSIGNYAFFECSSLTSVNIPNSVTSIGNDAFLRCSSLTSVNIPNSVTSIGGCAFSGCSSLTSVRIPDSVMSIGEGAFCACSSLTSVTIPNSVTSIGNDAFWNCSSLTSVSIPDSVTSIGDTAFYGCSSLTDIYYGGSEEQWKAITIGGNNDCLTSATIHYNSTGPEGGSSDPTATENITLMWEKTGWPIKKDDTSKPPYPNGTDAQYAEALRAWAQNANIRSITQSNAETLLEQPVYIPVDTTGNGDYLLLSDGNTNVRQAIEDIVFLENLSNYVAELDEEIAGVTFGVAAGQTFAGYSMKQEKDIYRKALSWNAQIQKYLDKRNQNSNMYTASLAAQAYLGLNLLVDNVGGETYKTYIKPFAKAVLQSTENWVNTDSLRDQAYYPAYKQLVEDVAATAIERAKTYTVTTECGGTLSLSYNALIRAFEHSGNATLKEIGETCSQFKSVYNAVKVSMFLGCSIGMFPMVVDLYNDMYKSATDEIKAMYFLADYYMEREYPAVYQALFSDGSGYPIDYSPMQVVQNPALQQGTYGKGHENDPVMYNWLWMWQYREKQWRKDCAGLRRDLTNYAVLLRFARDFDAASAKKALVEYLDAELHSGGMTTVSAKCPVTLNIYDLSHTLVASLSSESDSIPSIPGATLYLLGENQEEKYVVFDPDQYTVEIVPYGSGTMDVQITDDTDSISAFRNVPVAEGMKISVSPLEDDQLTVDDTANGNTVYSVTREEVVQLRNILLSGSSTMEVGEQQQLDVTTYPVDDSACSLLWSSSNTDVITVDDTGVITAHAAGSVTITAQETDTGKSASFTVHVVAAVQSITPSTETITLFEGDETAVSLTLQPATATLKDVKWSSNDPNVAMVDDSGKVYGINAGETTITAYAGDVEAVIQVTVQAWAYSAGDVNGDRVVSVLDMACLYTLLTNGWYDGSIENEDTVSQLTDVNGDDSIDVYDLQRLYEAVNGMRPFA